MNNLMMNRLKRLFVVCFVFMLIYQPPIAKLNVIHALVLVSIYMIYRCRNCISLTKQYYIYILLMFMNLVYYLIVSILSNNIMMAYSQFLFVVEIQICILAIYLYCTKNSIGIKNIILISAILQSIIAIICFFVQPIQEFLINVCIANGFPETTSWFVGKRFFGLSSQLTYTMPITQTVIAIFCMDYYIGVEKKKRCLLGAGLLVFSAIINARTAIVILAMGIVFILIKYRGRISKKPQYLIGGGVATILLMGIIYLVSRDTYTWIVTAVKEIFLLFKGNHEEGYFQVLFDDFLFLPDEVGKLFWGSGISVFRGVERNSDVGYIIDIWMVGILGMIIKYVSVIFPLFRMRKYEINVYFLISVLLISNIKGIAFEANELLALISIYIVFMQNNIEQKHNTKYKVKNVEKASKTM